MSNLKPGFSPEIIGQNISKLVKDGTAHKHAMKIAIEHARYEFRKGSPSAPFPSHLSCVDDKVMKNPVDPFTKKRVKRKSIKQKAGGTVSYPEYKKIGDKYVKVKKNPSRITEKQLEALIKRLNIATGSPVEPWTKDSTGKFKANIGNYHIESAYGSTKLSRMVSISGATSDIFGLTTKRALYNKILAMLDGLSVRKNPVRPLKKKKRSPRPWVAKKFSGDYFVDVLSGNPQQWLPLASFIRKEKAIEYAKAYTTRTNKKTRVYKDEATKN